MAVYIVAFTPALILCGWLAGAELGRRAALARFEDRGPRVERTFMSPPVASYLLSAPRPDGDDDA